MDPLTELAIKHGADKWGKHHYTPVYFDLFKDRRETVKKVLEIGTAEGAGLKVFRDFFPNATIYGAEIDKKRVENLQGLDRIAVFEFDQSLTKNIADLFDYLYDLDLVIDDGSHNPADQIFTCLGAMPFLNNDAIYIIEDVTNETAEMLFRLLTKYNITIKKVGDRYDDRLVIVRHKNG